MTPSERLHPATFLFAALATGRHLVVPAVLGGASAGGATGSVAVWILGLLALPSLIWAAATYVTFRYGIEGDDLVVDSGVVRRQRRVIPLARVQNVDVRQGALQRVAGVAEVRVETAGGQGTEALLRVLSLEAAGALRARLLEGRARPHAEEPEPEAGRLLARLGVGDLLLAGATSNEAGLMAAALAGGLQLVDELSGVLPLPGPETAASWLETRGLPLEGMGAVVLVALVVLAFTLAGWVLSIGGAVIGYHGFTLEERRGELHKRYGLLGRREAFVPLGRVQALRVEESWLRRPFGLAALRIETAGAGPQERQRGGAEAFLPLARPSQVRALLPVVLPGAELPTRLEPAHPHARRRAFARLAVAPVLAAPGLGLAVDPLFWLLLFLVPLAWLAAGAHYRSLGFALQPDHVVLRSGVLTRVTWIIPRAKVHVVHRSASPMQRRHQLDTLLVETASGALRPARVADLHAADALRLAERLMV